MLRILIADDHPLIRDGLRERLRGLDDEVTFFEAHDWPGAQALATAEPTLDLALVDLRMPGHMGFEALSALLAANPSLPVVVLSASEDVEDMRHALRLGAMGYVGKGERPAVLVGAVRLVLEGGMYLPPALAGPAFDGVPAPARPPTGPPLSGRQLEVLRLVAEGKSNKEIAQALDLAPATVKVHLAAVYRALGVENRTQAAMAAERLGLRRPPRG